MHGKSKSAVTARIVILAVAAGALVAAGLAVATGLSALVAYVLAFGLITFLTYGYDKQQAIRGRRRVPNTALQLLAVLGGAVGGMAGMVVWRHKINHASFWIAQGVGTLVIAAAFALG